MTSETFWINYSNLLLSVWSVPDLLGNLQSTPERILSYFELATVPGAKFEIVQKINQQEGGFQDQYDLFIEGHSSGNYVLYVPPQHPGVGVRGSTELAAAVEESSACCCCTCCPCCSCF
jgi:hypothetical protein